MCELKLPHPKCVALSFKVLVLSKKIVSQCDTDEFDNIESKRTCVIVHSEVTVKGSHICLKWVNYSQEKCITATRIPAGTRAI